MALSSRKGTPGLGLYENIVRELTDQLSAGAHPIGARLPAERELAKQYNVSRGTVKKAIIALQVRGFVEVRGGSGAYVKCLPKGRDVGKFKITAIELLEARMLFEGEAAALAASHITDEELAEMDALVVKLKHERKKTQDLENVDRDFHINIARAAQNNVVLDTVERLWTLWRALPEAALPLGVAHPQGFDAMISGHAQVLEALRARDPRSARTTIRANLDNRIENLLLAAGDGLSANESHLNGPRTAHNARRIFLSSLARD